MLQLPRRAVASFVALVRADPTGVRAGFVALLVSSGGDLVAGLTLGGITGTLESLPGLLVLVPAAIGMRGNIFGAMGSRLGTMVHAGTFRLSRRLDTPVGQSLAGALLLSLSISAALAVLAKAVAQAFGLSATISVVDFLVISVIGGALSSVVVGAITVGVAALAVRRSWDFDNVAAPIVTAAGDIVTLPGLLVATLLVGIPWVTPVVATLCAVAAAAALVAGLRARQPSLRRLVQESIVVLLAAALVDIVAGITIERRLESFLAFPALLVLVPPFLEDSGALGGILASRVSTKLHLGLVDTSTPGLGALAGDVMLIYAYAVPVFLLLGLSADAVAAIADLTSPGSVQMVGVSLLAGLLATTAAIVVGITAARSTHRLGLDPDNHGIPIVTSSLDLLGVLSLILAIALLGVA